MRNLLFVVGVTLAGAGVAAAEQQFALITAADADKATVTYSITFGKNRDNQVTAKVAKGCVIKEGYYRLGKPAKRVEGDDLFNGLRNPIFQKATPANGVRVNIYTADEDDQDRGVRRGDVIKILVNPRTPKKKSAP